MISVKLPLKYFPGMKIANVASLPGGVGARYLKVIPGIRPDEWVAKSWHRKLPEVSGIEVSVEFGPKDRY